MLAVLVMNALLSKFRLHRGVKVIKSIESIGLLAISKPSNTLCHPNNLPQPKVKYKSIVDCPYDHEKECYFDSNQSQESRLYLLHRLDLGTSGVLLMSTSEKTALKVKKLFRMRQVSKQYRALVFCAPNATLPSAGEIWKDDLNQRGKQVIAKTLLSSIIRHATIANTALLTLEPATGFTHQLRVQCANRQLPIVGDDIYGNFPLNKKLLLNKTKLLLHAESVTLRVDNAVYTFADPLPDSFP